jgi:uncharacterized membrane protein YgdD (TMEM256/DUF423 family)
MRFAIQACGLLIGIPLEIMVIAALLRGGYRRFPLIFVYAILNFLATVVEIPPAWAYLHGVQGGAARMVGYWWNDEGVFQLLNYLVVMSLIYQATATLPSRRILRASLFMGALLFSGITFLIHYSPQQQPGAWMTSWTRDLNFCSAVLDLALWALLISMREKDYRVLMLSGGMGIQFTGEAIGQSLRQLSQRDHSLVLARSGAILIMISNLALMFIWWRAFRTAPDNQVISRRRAPANG